MRILLLKRMALVTLSLMLFSSKTLALELSPKKSDTLFDCLSRDQKEKIQVCFEQNASCHDALAKTVSVEKPPSVQIFGLAILIGFAAGMMAATQIRH